MTTAYGVIYADPPWTFQTHSDKGKGRSAEAHYDCMSLADIKALPVADMAAQDCVLLLWVTDPHLRNAFDVIEAWGFAYKTVGFYWAKAGAEFGYQRGRTPRLADRHRLLDPRQSRTMPACHPRPSQAPKRRCPQADCLPATRAQPQAG